MDFFNYVMVLASIIVGLALTHLLQGVAQIVQHPERHRTYWVHLIWVAVVFETAILWWWWEFRFSSGTVWTFELYVFVLIFAVVIYLLAALLFPSSLEGYEGYRDYYYSRRYWFFGLNLLFNAMDITDTLLKGTAHFVSLGWQYPVMVGVQCALFVAAMITRNEKVHASAALLMLLSRTVIAVTSLHTMQ